MTSLADLLDSMGDSWFEEEFEPVVNPGMKMLSELDSGDEFKIGDEIFILLENSGYGRSMVIRKDFLETTREFGRNANWAESPVREYLNSEYLERIASIVGEQNIYHFERDLTSLDGLDDYGTVMDRVSLFTAAEYAKYHRILGLRSRYRHWWWTITPFSTPSNDYARGVCYVLSGGALYWGGCGFCRGVRPFLILNSSIYVSLNLEEE